MKNVYLLITVLFIMLLASCYVASKAEINEAERCLNTLKQGVLLVRLKTGSNQIKLLRQAGKNAEADEIAKFWETENKAIIKAFSKEYTFSPVLFFLNTSTDSLRSRKTKGIFINDSLQRLPDDLLGNRPYLIAELDELEAPSSNFGLPALVVRDSTFKQLRRPFPFFIRMQFRNYESGVFEFNKKLLEYSQRVMRKKEKQGNKTKIISQ
ncbi:MAG: hypothetical protein N2167_04955 [Flavobacteriales bacterium]|nr:hypothetical protein [Flavobacteriales bacterium]